MASTAFTVIEGGKKSTEVIEVSTAQLTEHSKQAEYSPQMSKKKWREFVASVAKEGILQPIVVTKGFRVIDGKHRLKAAKELNIEYVRVIIEDIPEDDIPAYITATKLARDDLKSGQRAALVIRLFYEEERIKAERRKQATQFGSSSAEVESFPLPEVSGKTRDVLGKKAGTSGRYIGSLLAVYRNRPDLFERVFNGEYSINRAYTQMKADEEPEEVPQEEPLAADAKAVIERAIREEHMNPQIDESQPAHAPHNRIVQMRKKALSLTAEIIDEAETIKKVDAKVKESARKQLMSLTQSCIIALGHTADKEEDAEMLLLCLELLEKINGGDQ